MEVKKHILFATLSAMIEFSDEEFSFLEKVSKRHYDSTVKSMFDIGNFMYGYKNRREFSKVCNLSMRQLGLLAKSLEIETKSMSRPLMKRLLDAMKDINSKSEEINKQLQNEK